MRFRLKKTPRGAARFAYAYLGAVVAAAIAGLITVIATAIADALPTCQSDREGTCTATLAGMVGTLALFAAFFLVARILRLGWQWAAWLVALSLILIQIVIEASAFTPAWSLVLLPALASLITFRRPAAPPSRTVNSLRLVALIVAFVQFLIWFVLLLS